MPFKAKKETYYTFVGKTPNGLKFQPSQTRVQDEGCQKIKLKTTPSHFGEEILALLQAFRIANSSKLDTLPHTRKRLTQTFLFLTVSRHTIIWYIIYRQLIFQMFFLVTLISICSFPSLHTARNLLFKKKKKKGKLFK